MHALSRSRLIRPRAALRRRFEGGERGDDRARVFLEIARKQVYRSRARLNGASRSSSRAAAVSLTAKVERE